MRSTLRRLITAALIAAALLSPAAGVASARPDGGCASGRPCPQPPTRLCPPGMTPVQLGCHNGDGTFLR